MKEEMKTVEENVVLPEAPWITFSIETEHRELFENFCNRNQIPFEEVHMGDEKITYCVRDGIDEQDVCSYMLRITYVPGNWEVNNIIYCLFQLRLYFCPQFMYELNAFRTEEDEWLLSHFDDFMIYP